MLFLSSLPISVLRNFELEANKLYDRANKLYKAALLTRCYVQHFLSPYIDSEVNHKRHFIKIPFINKGIKFIYLHSIFKDNSVILSIPKYFKGLYLSKALTCMNIFLYKQELLFCQGDGNFWPHCCMNNLYISHRSLYAPTYSFCAISSMLISLFRVTSWFDTVNNAVTRWMNFRENHLHEHDLQLFYYNI